MAVLVSHAVCVVRSLMCEEIDVGEAAPRLIVSGLRKFYTAAQMTVRCSVRVRPAPSLSDDIVVGTSVARLCAGTACTCCG